MTTHGPARKTGLAYPITALPAAPEVGRADIMALEEARSLIRIELAFLGKLRRQVSSFYRSNPEEAEEDIVTARAKQGAKATW